MISSKFLCFGMLAIFPSFAYADSSVTITKIADTNTPIPGETGDFTGFGIPSSDRDFDSFDYVGPITPSNYYHYSNIFFTAQGANGYSGVFLAVFPEPGITEIADIADTTMTAPTGGQFTSFSNTTSGEDEVGYIGTDSNGVEGVYLYHNVYGGPSLIAASNTPINGTTFGDFQSISFYSEGSGLTPAGEIESATGIYDFSYNYPGLSFTLIANTSTIPPGASSPFTSFGPISYKAPGQSGTTPGFASTERAVLATVGGTPGIYYGKTGPYATSAPLVKLVDTNTPVPGGNGDFSSFGIPIATAAQIEFTAGYMENGQPQQGIFIYGPYLNPEDVPELQEVLASGTVAPDSDGAHFVTFSQLSDHQETGGPLSMVFLATLDNGQSGLYDTFEFGGDNVVKIIDTGDELDGKIVSSIELSPDAGGWIFTSFEANFTDGSSGIFYFDTDIVPEPASLGLLALPALLMLRRR